MMSLTEKLAYIQGLCEGMELDGTTKEGKVLLAIVDLLDDLTDVEDALLYDDEDEDEDEDDDDDECCCGGHGHHHHHHHHHGEDCGCGCHDDEDEEEWDDEDLTDLYDEENPLYEITCPNCNEVVCMDEDMLFSPDCACPNCGTSFEIEFDEECDCEECAEEDEE